MNLHIFEYCSILYLLAISTSFTKDFSQAYILITWIPLIISLMRRTLSSVLEAVLSLHIEEILPMYTVNEN